MTNDTSLPAADHAGGDEPQNGPVVDSIIDYGTYPAAAQSPCVQERLRVK